LPAWLDTPAVKAALAPFLGVKDAAAVDAQGSFWTQAVSQAVTRSREDVTKILTERGYTAAQLLTWDNLADAHRDQALYWCSVYSGGKGLKPDVIATLRELDRRPTLPGDVILSGGEPIYPPEDTTIPGPIGHGDMKTADSPFLKF
jgi:hypothetical protein